MFLLGLIIGLILGSNISLFLYAMIIVGKQADDVIQNITPNIS